MEEKMLSKSFTTTLFKCDKGEIPILERKVDFPSIVESSEPSVLSLRKSDYDSLYIFATNCAVNFLSICYPNQIHLAPIIASDLIDSRPIWKAADFINCFKFVRQRQDLDGLRIIGNQITVPKFMELVSVYEVHRAEALEQFHAKKKVQDANLSERGQGESIKALMGKSLEEISAKNEKNRERQVYQSKSDESFFERNNRFSFTEKSGQ